MFSCSALLFLRITAWLRVSLQNSQKAHERSCCVSFGKTGWRRKERGKKSVRMCYSFTGIWKHNREFRMYLLGPQLKLDKEFVWG